MKATSSSCSTAVARSNSLSMLFDYQPRTRVVFGVNSIERVGELAKSIDARKVLLVTDRGIAPLPSNLAFDFAQRMFQLRRNAL